jgi:hypothetical protein
MQVNRHYDTGALILRCSLFSGMVSIALHATGQKALVGLDP